MWSMLESDGLRFCSCSPLNSFAVFSQTRVVVVTLLVPIVVRTHVRVGYAANLLELFNPVFEWGYQTERGAVLRTQGLAVQLVGEKGLRMQCDFALEYRTYAIPFSAKNHMKKK